MGFRITSVVTLRNLVNDITGIRKEIGTEGDDVLECISEFASLLDTNNSTELKKIEGAIGELCSDISKVLGDISYFINDQVGSYTATEDEFVSFIRQAQKNIDAVVV